MWLRLPKKSLFLAIILGLVLAGCQLLQLRNPIPAIESPYTRWLAVDPFNFSPIIFFLLLPLIASLPAGILLKADHDRGLLNQLRLHWSQRKILVNYFSLAFITGFLVILLPLVLNFITYFLFLPNIQPDNLLNINILLTNLTTMFAPYYYSHAFFHAFFYLLFASLWGGLFAVFVSGLSLWIKNRFVAFSASLIVQIAVFVLNNLIRLPNLVSYSPADFLHELSPMTNVSLEASFSATLIMLVCCGILFWKGGRRFDL
ncbi:hypothetical protein HU830_06275 [Lactobacillus sp. DCY120]|uniref:Uncharacterized protein n=1 Tax=Bombilactobacillus apium TaxID=2675299 RepID=A0A850R326_9LACO|nr:hypothetical protein [Bombilactobacillus apium]NVY96760.1 hypothetical protein [Bombilactobacillus apium]